MTSKHLLAMVSLACLMACSGNNQENTDAHDHTHGAATGETHQHGDETSAEETAKPKSPPRTAMANIGDTHVHIAYHAPSVRGRQIFGGLVAYDEVWVTGAHNATTVEFPNAVRIDGETVAEGKYALFTIPGKTEWTIILNENYEQHLADEYDASLDVVRFTVQPETLSEPQEQLTYRVEETAPGEGHISIAWADVQVVFSVQEL